MDLQSARARVGSESDNNNSGTKIEPAVKVCIRDNGGEEAVRAPWPFSLRRPALTLSIVANFRCCRWLDSTWRVQSSRPCLGRWAPPRSRISRPVGQCSRDMSAPQPYSQLLSEAVADMHHVGSGPLPVMIPISHHTNMGKPPTGKATDEGAAAGPVSPGRRPSTSEAVTPSHQGMERRQSSNALAQELEALTIGGSAAAAGDGVGGAATPGAPGSGERKQKPPKKEKGPSGPGAGVSGSSGPSAGLTKEQRRLLFEQQRAERLKEAAAAAPAAAAAGPAGQSSSQGGKGSGKGEAPAGRPSAGAAAEASGPGPSRGADAGAAGTAGPQGSSRGGAGGSSAQGLGKGGSGGGGGGERKVKKEVGPPQKAACCCCCCCWWWWCYCFF